MADKRTTTIFISAMALLLPAIGFTAIVLMKLWRGPAEGQSTGLFAVEVVTALLLAAVLWWIGGVLLRRGVRSRAIAKERDRPKILT